MLEARSLGKDPQEETAMGIRKHAAWNNRLVPAVLLAGLWLVPVLGGQAKTGLWLDDESGTGGIAAAGIGGGGYNPWAPGIAGPASLEPGSVAVLAVRVPEISGWSGAAQAGPDPAGGKASGLPVELRGRLPGGQAPAVHVCWLRRRLGRLEGVAYFAVPAATPPGQASLELRAWSSDAAPLRYGIWHQAPRPFRLEHSFTVSGRHWQRETIPLTGSMETIRDDRSLLKAEQARHYAAILAGRDAQAVFLEAPWGEPHRLAAGKGGSPGTSASPAALSRPGVFRPVVPDIRRTSLYGDRRLYAYPDGRTEPARHWGVDYGLPVGVPVSAPARGRVVLAEERVVTGWTVILEHLPGLFSIYMHLDRLLVRPGQLVLPGMILGHSGQSGFATGPHLHWELRLDGLPLDPESLLAAPD